MPPFDEDGNIVDCSGMMMFFRNDAGEFVPMQCLQEMTMPEIDDPKYEDATRIMGALTAETELTFTMTHASQRKIAKMIKASLSRRKRMQRQFKRLKEKYRRECLKAGGHR